jgi:hypothetical protein
MKNMLRLSLICIIAAGLFSSCSSNYSITKRLYNKGYYVNHSKHKKSDPSIKEEKSIQAKTEDSLNSAQLIPEQRSVLPAEEKVLVNNTITEPKIEKKQSKEFSTAANVEKKQSKTINKQNAVKPFKIESPFRNVNNTLSYKTKFENNASQDALSLLWIVIAVVLILWLIGFAAGGFGLGWVIHLLLVVALILLILWLLKII